MKILGLDTALGACSAALVADGRLLARAFEEMPRGHAEALAPMVDSLMRKAGWAYSALDRIGVTTGPGTFTGQRVGLAFARAMALALKVPAIGVATLDAMAEEALAKVADADWAVVAADAKRGEIYLSARTRAGETFIAPELVLLSNALERIGEPRPERRSVAIAGTAAEMLIPLLRERAFNPIDSGVRQPDAVFVARLAADAPEGQAPTPLYLRPPDAKLPGPVRPSARIRLASLADTGHLASLHRACFDEAWDEAAFHRLLDRPGAFAFLAASPEAENDSQAFILVQVAAGECEILSLGTIGAARRKGLARSVLMAAAKEAHRLGAREMFLEVADDNRAAIALYCAAGFAVIGRRPKYYRRADGTALDAIMLRATLPL